MTDITARARRFKIGDKVDYRADAHHRGTPPGVYQVIRLLPPDGQDYQYRVKDNRDGSERAVRESELS